MSIVSLPRNKKHCKPQILTLLLAALLAILGWDTPEPLPRPPQPSPMPPQPLPRPRFNRWAYEAAISYSLANGYHSVNWGAF